MSPLRGERGASAALRARLKPRQLPAPLALPKDIQDWSLRSVQVKLLKTGAGMVRHVRSVFLQWPGVRVSREVFAALLKHIDRLRLAGGDGHRLTNKAGKPILRASSGDSDGVMPVDAGHVG